jgi:RNA polymerase sigma-70 factor (family 1)
MSSLPYNNQEDLLLLVALKQGDKTAYEKIFRKYWKIIYISAYKKIKLKQVAEELTQDIFVSLWEKRHQNEIKVLESYLMTAIKYKVINYIDACIVRDKIFNNLKSSSTDSFLPHTESAITAKEILAAIEVALSSIPEKTRIIFKLSRFEHFSVKEIASKLDMNEKAVEYHITQSLKTLKIYLKDFILTASAVIILHH